MTDVYKILIRQGHVKEEVMTWAPAEGHNIDLSVLDEPDRLDPRVVSLMEKLPTSGGSIPDIMPEMVPVWFMNATGLIRSRDIDKYVDHEKGPPYPPLDQTNALPTVIQLLDGRESTSPVLILDVADNTIRHFNEVYNEPSYLDSPAEHAPTYLKRSWGSELRRIFVEDYHWPDEDFRREDWIRDAGDIVGRLVDVEQDYWEDLMNLNAATRQPPRVPSPIIDPELLH
ncbi:hypothetical protein LTR17_003548 [Elasticomyces elasticus]|nr:hypothetical protein LTR17_003548 [Elasticomyces elasticus]